MQPLDVEVVGESILGNRESILGNRESILGNRESIDESIRDKWVGAIEAQKLTSLNKPGLQKAISHLLAVRNCRIDSIRKGNARQTRYSLLAIELIKARACGNENLMKRLLLLAEPPATPKCSTLATPNHVASLEEKITYLRETSASNSKAIGDRILGKLAAIAACNQATQGRSETLNAAELQAAENRGIEQALAIFSAEEAAKENALAHLRALKISGNQ